MLYTNHPALDASNIAMLIAAARRYYRQLVIGGIEDLDLTPHQAWMLTLLHEKAPLSMTQLSQCMWMDMPTVSRMVKQLASRQLLLVRADPTHRRRLCINIHPGRGESVVAELAKRATRLRDEIESVLSPTEDVLLRSCLSKLIVRMDDILRAQGTAEMMDAHPVPWDSSIEDCAHP